MGTSAPLVRTIEANIPATAAASTADQIVGEAPFAGTVTGVSYTPEADITGAASPASRTFTLVNKGQDGSGTTVVATLAMLSGVNASDFDERALTLSEVEGATTVAAGDVLAFVSTAVGGTGLADPGGRVQVTVSRA